MKRDLISDLAVYSVKTPGSAGPAEKVAENKGFLNKAQAKRLFLKNHMKAYECNGHE